MKRSGSIILAGLVAVVAMAAQKPSLDAYIDNLKSLTDYAGDIRYSVLLPQAEDPVEFDVSLASTLSPDDRLSPCSYLIEWRGGQSDGGSPNGFTAYFDGSHYRYRDNRLQEYHMQWDSIPFLIQGGGVQRTAQFVDVLPQMVGRELEKLVADSNFTYVFTPDTLYNGNRAVVLKGKLMYHGYTGKEITYVFDPGSKLPLVAEMENNPGAISEQTVTIRYTSVPGQKLNLDSEDKLIARYPEVFEKFRESNFRAENLPGTALPTFSAPSVNGQRYTHHRGDRFDNMTLILVLDDAVDSVSETLEAVRDARGKSPVHFDLILAFVSNHGDRAEELAGAVQPGEQLLLGARSLARDCGVTVYPTILYIGRDGVVKDVTLGYNKDLSNVVIQKIMINK